MSERPRTEAPWLEALGGERLLVSGFGKWGGGVYDLTSGTAVALDDIPTSGLGVGGDRLWRVLRAPGEQTALCELLCYDDRGLRTYQRLDPIRDPHDVCWHDGAVHITSSWDSTIWRLDPDGGLRPAWRGTGMPDSWHVNSLVVVDGRLHVSAFGRFDRYKAWRSETGRVSGFVMDVTTEQDVLAGLAHPHNPHWDGTHWYVCESTRGTLTECAPDGSVLRRAKIKRFARGMTVVGGWAFVGGNAHRSEDDDRADIAVVDLDTFEVVDRIEMPCLEIYDIRTVPASLARAVAIGFGANAARAVEQQRASDRSHTLRATNEAARLRMVTPRVAKRLESAGRTVAKDQANDYMVHGSLPAQVTAGDVLALGVTVENQSRTPLATVPPHPIRIGARWSSSDDTVVRNPLTPLPELVYPGETSDVEVLLEVPEEPGQYEVRVALHQAGLGWFGMRIQDAVVVGAPDEPVGDTAVDGAFV
jgi:hypothetical protein